MTTHELLSFVDLHEQHFYNVRGARLNGARERDRKSKDAHQTRTVKGRNREGSHDNPSILKCI